MAKHKKRMRRITGVAAKIQRMKSTVEAIVKYILDTVKEEEKLLCPAWIQQIRLPETRTGEKLTPRQFSHALTTEVKRILEGVQVNRCPCVELTISLAPGEAWSPKQWQKFWRHFLHHLSRVTYVTDHCVRRTLTPVLDENGRTQMKMKRSRPPRFFQADLSQFPGILPVHDNAPSQHLQSMLVFCDPKFRQVAVINGGFSEIAVQWAARRAERDLGLSPHPNMPDYEALTQGRPDKSGHGFLPVDNRLHVVDPKLIQRCGKDMFMFKGKRTVDPEKIPEQLLKGQIMRNKVPAIVRMRAILADRTPESFTSLAKLGLFLKGQQACLLRPDKTAGLQFCIGGSLVKPKAVDETWSSLLLLTRWPQLKKRGAIIGMQPRTQKRLAETQNVSRRQAAGISGFKPTREELDVIVKTSHIVIDLLPWTSFLIEERRDNGTAFRCGKLTGPELKAKIATMFDFKKPVLNQTLHFRPVTPAGVTALPLWDLTRANADRLQENYQVALLSETQPDRFNALVLLQPFAGEPWEIKRATRRLTHWLARRYQAAPNIVADDGVPLPGLPALAGTGHITKLIGPVRNQSCPKLSRGLEMFATRLARLETYWWQGTPGWVLRQSGVIHLPLEFDRKTQDARKIYLDHVKVLAKNPLRCATLSEMNARIAARMHGQRRKPLEIMEVFQIVKKLWPTFVPDSPEESLDHPREFNVNYSRDKSLFERAPAPRPSPKSDTQAGPVAKTTASSSAVPSVFHKVREPQTLPDGPIEPDFVYEQKQMPILGRWFLWALAKAEAIIGQPALEQPIAPEPVDVKAQQQERAKDILTKMIAVMEQLRSQRRPAAIVTDPPLKAQTLTMSPAITTKIVSSPAPATSSPSVQPLRKAPIASPLEMTLPAGQIPRVDIISSPVSASKKDPAPQKTNPVNPSAPPTSIIGNDEAEELRRRKKEKRQLRLEAVAGLLITLEKSEDGLATLDRHELQFKTVLVFDKLWRSLLDDPAPQRLAEMQQWLDNQEQETPEWLHPAMQIHESELNRELEAGPTRGNLPLLNTTGDILTR